MSDPLDEIAMWINERTPACALQVLANHRLYQCGFAGAPLAGYINVRETIFLFDTEDPTIATKFSASKM